jgi:hypothetical protein
VDWALTRLSANPASSSGRRTIISAHSALLACSAGSSGTTGAQPVSTSNEAVSTSRWFFSIAIKATFDL